MPRRRNPWDITIFRPAIYGGIYLGVVPIFALIFWIAPGVEIFCSDVPCDFYQALYFSVVTITTLGYGDIVPGNVATQLLAAAEALLGITVIGLFLNALSHRLARESSEAEKLKEEHERHMSALAQFRGHDSLVQLHIDRYLQYAAPITTPIDQRGAFKEKEKSKSFTPNPNFSFNDMKDLFKPTLFLTDNHFKPAIAYFFEAQRDLITSVVHLIRGTELRRWPDLEDLCLKFIMTCKSLDFSEYILGQPNVRLGDKKGSEFDSELIENHEGPIELQPSNSKNAYIALYFLIKKNIEFAEKYRSAAKQIRSES